MTIRFGIILLLMAMLCSCEGDYWIEFEWTSMEINNARFDSEQPQFTSVDSMRSNIYAIQLDLGYIENIKEGRYLDRETIPQNLNRLNSINITSNSNIETTYPSGVSLNDLFSGYNGSFQYSKPIDEFEFSNQYSPNYYDQPIPNQFHLLLTQGSHNFEGKFYVEMKLNDGTVFIDSTETIILY